MQISEYIFNISIHKQESVHQRFFRNFVVCIKVTSDTDYKRFK